MSTKKNQKAKLSFEDGGILDDLFSEIFKPATPFPSFTDMLNDFTEQIQFSMQCKMRRFYLVRNVDVDPDKVSGTGIIAEGTVFEDGTAVMRWKTQHTSTAIYANIEELLAIHGHNGKTVIKYIDAENVL